MGAITTEPKSTSSTTAALELSEVNLENGNGSVSEQTLTGLGPLRNARRLVIKQRIRLCDIVSLCTGCEVEKKYTIHGDSNEILYWGREKSNFCMRLCCGSMRQLSIHVSDQTENSVLELRRPLNCMGCCCRVAYPFCTQQLSVAIGGETLGFIRERATWCYPVYHLFDSVGSHTMKIRGPFCHFGCFSDVVYHVTNCEGQELATVTKRWLGFCTEAVTDIDNFVVEYSDIADVSVQDKAMILAATFLIDLMYYEESG